MKEIKLTQGKIAQVDDEDYNYLIQWKWRAKKGRDTYYAFRYEMIAEAKKMVYMHREVLKLNELDVLPDHKDLNGLNNQKNNLRIANRSQNMANRRSFRNSTSQYKGVSFDGGKWRASIQKNRKAYYLGRYASEQEAALAYNKKAIEFHGEYAYLNALMP